MLSYQITTLDEKDRPPFKFPTHKNVLPNEPQMIVQSSKPAPYEMIDYAQQNVMMFSPHHNESVKEGGPATLDSQVTIKQSSMRQSIPRLDLTGRGSQRENANNSNLEVKELECGLDEQVVNSGNDRQGAEDTLCFSINSNTTSKRNGAGLAGEDAALMYLHPGNATVSIKA